MIVAYRYGRLFRVAGRLAKTLLDEPRLRGLAAVLARIAYWRTTTVLSGAAVLIRVLPPRWLGRSKHEDRVRELRSGPTGAPRDGD